MRIVIVTTQVFFVEGGAEYLARGLRDALTRAGHDASIAAIPFWPFPPERILDQMLSARLLNLDRTVSGVIDLVIGLKFPAYLVEHQNKVLWILHQHRAAYNFWDHAENDLRKTPGGLKIRNSIYQSDIRCIPEAKSVFTIAQTVSDRLQKYCGIASEAIYNPPFGADEYYCANAEDFLFFPSRIESNKRQILVLEALAKTSNKVNVYFAGVPDNPEYQRELVNKVAELKIIERVTWLGKISEEEKRDYYSRALAVIYPPFDEDYGYVTLEAMLASKPVITCTDSGGPLEFVKHQETGFCVESTPEGIAIAMDEVWDNRDKVSSFGRSGRDYYHSLNISWNNVVDRLLG